MNSRNCIDKQVCHICIVQNSASSSPSPLKLWEFSCSGFTEWQHWLLCARTVVSLNQLGHLQFLHAFARRNFCYGLMKRCAEHLLCFFPTFSPVCWIVFFISTCSCSKQAYQFIGFRDSIAIFGSLSICSISEIRSFCWISTLHREIPFWAEAFSFPSST